MWKALHTLLALCAFAPTGAVHAPTLEKQALAGLGAPATRIFVARVLSTVSDGDQVERQIFTRVEFAVREGVKNAAAGERIAMRFLGGSALVPGHGVVRLDVPGLPSFVEGSRVLLLALHDPNLFCPVAGWSRGSFEVVRDPQTGNDVVCVDGGAGRVTV